MTFKLTHPIALKVDLLCGSFTEFGRLNLYRLHFGNARYQNVTLLSTQSDAIFPSFELEYSEINCTSFLFGSMLNKNQEDIESCFLGQVIDLDSGSS